MPAHACINPPGLPEGKVKTIASRKTVEVKKEAIHGRHSLTLPPPGSPNLSVSSTSSEDTTNRSPQSHGRFLKFFKRSNKEKKSRANSTTPELSRGLQAHGSAENIAEKVRLGDRSCGCGQDLVGGA